MSNDNWRPRRPKLITQNSGSAAWRSWNGSIHKFHDEYSKRTSYLSALIAARVHHGRIPEYRDDRDCYFYVEDGRVQYFRYPTDVSGFSDYEIAVKRKVAFDSAMLELQRLELQRENEKQTEASCPITETTQS